MASHNTSTCYTKKEILIMDSSDSVNCVQLNCHHSKSVTASLQNTMITSTTLVLLQEPYLYQGVVSGFSRALVMHAAGENPRACIVAGHKVNVWPDPAFTSRDMATVVLKGGRQNTYISSIYLDITHEGVTLSSHLNYLYS